MSKQQEAKKIVVGEIVEALKNAKSFIFFQYTTLTGKEITELRKKLYTHNAHMHVYKNTLLKRAFDEEDYELTLMPHTADTDGFYIAVFGKKVWNCLKI